MYSPSMQRKGAGLQAMSKPLFMHQPRHKDMEDPSVGARPEESTMRASPLQILCFESKDFSFFFFFYNNYNNTCIIIKARGLALALVENGKQNVPCFHA